jgi:hypothetical protein
MQNEKEKENIRTLYLSILETDFKDIAEGNINISVGKIPKDASNYMGYIFTHILWNFWLKYSDTTSRIVGFHKLIDNTFMTNRDLEDLYRINERVGKIWNAFNKMARIWRWKRAKTYNTEDLYMNPIISGQKNTMTIMKNNTKYLFQLKELIGNLNRELSNSCNMFVEPLPCKNPYTNEFFNKSDLYNIYFAIKESTFIMPLLIHKYFLCDFSLSKFTNENEDMIHEYYVDNYTKHITTDVLLRTIKQMLMEHKITNIRIHVDFPKSILKEKMMPYLKLYFISKLSMNKWKKASSYMKLHRMLQDIVNDTPGFGRKKYVPTVLNNGTKTYLKYYYDDNIPKICREPLKDYMNDHLDLKIRETSFMMIHYDVIMNQRRRVLISQPLNSQRNETNESMYISSDTSSDEENNQPDASDREQDESDDDNEEDE